MPYTYLMEIDELLYETVDDAARIEIDEYIEEGYTLDEAINIVLAISDEY